MKGFIFGHRHISGKRETDRAHPAGLRPDARQPTTSGVAVGEARLPLDEQEIALVRLLAEGLVLEAIARRLSVSERTLRRRIRGLCDRFDVETPVQVVVWAARNGVL